MSKRILVVDDSAVIRLTLHDTLKKEGYDVIEAQDGHEALGKLESGESINMIICDVNMPGMDGLTFVRTYKANEALKFIPVLMLTTETSPEMKQAGKEAGAKAWLVKPFKKDLLMAAVSKLAI